MGLALILATPPCSAAERGGLGRRTSVGKRETSYGLHLLAADRLAGEGAWDRVISELQAALWDFPNHPVLLRRLTRAYLAGQDWVRAAETFDALAEADTVNAEDLCGWATSLLVMGMNEEAAARLDLARELDPGYGRARLLRSVVDLRNHDPASARNVLAGLSLPELVSEGRRLQGEETWYRAVLDDDDFRTLVALLLGQDPGVAMPKNEMGHLAATVRLLGQVLQHLDADEPEQALHALREVVRSGARPNAVEEMVNRLR